MKKTFLYENHVRSKARIVDFGGWAMPVQYSGILKEHQAVRTKAGVFDTSHMGEIIVRGKKSLDLVQRLTTNDASKLEELEAQYSIMCHKDGGIIDDLYVYRIGKREYMLVVNACNTKKDFKHMNRIAKNYSDVEIEDVSNKLVMIAVQGPKSEDLLKKIYRIQDYIPEKKNTLTRFSFVVSEVMISRTGYTGEDGFELFFRGKSLADGIWGRFIEEKAVLCGLGARDTLRLEMGYPLYGNELNDETTPLEAGLEKYVCFEKDFLGKKALVKQKENGLERKLVGFELIDKGVARQYHKVVKTGDLWRFFSNYEVTSGTKLVKSIGLAYVPADYDGEDLVINVM